MRSDNFGRTGSIIGSLMIVGGSWLAAACGSEADGSSSTSSSVDTTVTIPGSATTVVAAPTGVDVLAAVPPTGPPTGFDPTFTATPIGKCDSIVPNAVGFRNTTGNIANEYRKLGNTWTGRSIWAEHWGPLVGPQVLLIGQVHGNECAPAWVVREMRARPPMAYGLWIIPTLNPDGLAAFDRRNHNGIDLNRDGATLESIELNLLIDFVKEVQPILSIHLHAPLGFIGTFNGASNGGVADRVGLEISRQVGWGELNSAGTNTVAEGLFIWQAIDRAIPGSPSLLIELPSVSFDESPGAPNRTQRSYGNVTTAEIFARVVRDTLEAEFGAK